MYEHIHPLQVTGAVNVAKTKYISTITVPVSSTTNGKVYKCVATYTGMGAATALTSATTSTIIMHGRFILLNMQTYQIWRHTNYRDIRNIETY